MHAPGIVEAGCLVALDDVAGHRVALVAQGGGQALGRGLVLPGREEQDVGPFLGALVKGSVESEEQVVQVEGEACGRCRETVTRRQAIVTAAGADRPAEPGQEPLEDQPAMVIETAHFTKV